MKAIVQHSYGIDALTLGTAPDPVPRPGRVLVRVAAAGIDQGTWHLVTGLPRVVRLGTGLRSPRAAIPGRDLAGTVEAVGPGVTAFAPGDEVLGIGSGALAELAEARADRLVHRPAGLDAAAAAALPISGLTGLQAVRDAGRVSAGQRVLVIGAAGGVGSFATQAAVALGARVTGVARAAKHAFVRELGAHDVVDHAATDLATLAAQADGFDVVVDTGGNRGLRELRRLVRRRGTVVIVGGETGGGVLGGFQRQLGAAFAGRAMGARMPFFFSRETADDLAALTRMVEAGTLAPRVDSTFPLVDAAQALDRLRSGQVRGKVVVTI